MERIDVTFSGDGAGEAPLTWGQQSMCRTMQHERSWLPMGGHRPVPAGATVADVVAELRYTVGRYQSLRTRLRLTGPAQVVASTGVTHLEMVQAGDEDPVTVGMRIDRAYRATEPDLERDWPLRMAVVCVGTTPARLVAIMPHLVTDGIGATIMIDEVARRVATPVAGLQPLELPAWQSSAAGARTHTAAARHWERHAGVVDILTGVPLAPRYRKCLFTSPGLAAALPAVAARAGMDASTVLLTAFMTVLGGLTGRGRVAVRQMVSNRFRGGLSDVVSPVAQLGLCVADVSGEFTEALFRVGGAALSARKNAYYDPLRIPDVRTACFNDRRGAALPGGSASGAGLPAPGTLVWTEPPVGRTEPLFVHVDDVPGAVQLTLDVDTAAFTPAEVEACARGIEATITALVPA